MNLKEDTKVAIHRQLAEPANKIMISTKGDERKYWIGRIAKVLRSEYIIAYENSEYAASEAEVSPVIV